MLRVRFLLYDLKVMGREDWEHDRAVVLTSVALCGGAAAFRGKPGEPIKLEYKASREIMFQC